MSIITLDFETFYDKEFSLSKLTTELYIRDKRFEVIGFGYSIDGAQPQWVTGSDEVIEARLHELEIHKHSLICHNTAFDGAILAWRYGIIPKQYFCTLSMAKPIHSHTRVGGSLAKLAKHYELGAKGTEVVDALGKRRAFFSRDDLAQYGEYCKNDVMLTWQLFQKLLPHIPKSELYLIDLLMRMYTDPILELDTPLLEQHLQSVRANKEELLRRVQDADKDILMSNPKFAALLEKLGVKPPTKTSPANGKETYAFSKTDPAFKALQDHEDPRVQAVVAARLGVKSTLEETRTESLIGVASRGKLPIMLQYYGAATGRLCLTGDTAIHVLRDASEITIRLDELQATDLVWDGRAYVGHDGLADRGVKHVIEYDGIVGTPDHRVFVEGSSEPVELHEARQRGYKIQTPTLPQYLEVEVSNTA